MCARRTGGSGRLIAERTVRRGTFEGRRRTHRLPRLHEEATVVQSARRAEADEGRPMTVDVGRRRAKAAAAGGTDRSDGPSGEIGQTIFGCPACGRPLAIGVRRCPSCSARLVMGVRAGRAAMFVTIGLIVGVAFGGGLAATLTAIRLPERDAEVARAV